MDGRGCRWRSIAIVERGRCVVHQRGWLAQARYRDEGKIVGSGGEVVLRRMGEFGELVGCEEMGGE